MDANFVTIVLTLLGVVGVLFGVMAFLAYLIETIVEALLAPIFVWFPNLVKWKPAQGYIAIGLGLVGAFLFKFDVLYLVGMLFSQLAGTENPIVVSWYGIMLTGFSLGMGSQYIHRLVQKIAPSKTSANETVLTPLVGQIETTHEMKQ